VRVRNVIAKLRPFAANITYLCHLNLLQTCLQFPRQPELPEAALIRPDLCYTSSETGEGANEDTLTLQLAESPVYPEAPFRPNRRGPLPLKIHHVEARGKPFIQKEIPFRTSRKGNGEFSHEM
jgi:hypothetical protein